MTKIRVIPVLFGSSLILHTFPAFSLFLDYQIITAFPANNISSPLNQTALISNDTLSNSINQSAPAGDDTPSFLKVVLNVDNTGGGTFQ